MRKRALFKDLVHLADQPSDRVRHLFVLGSEPIQFLTTSRSTAAWALDRFPAARTAYARSFGSLGVEIREFTAERGGNVEIVDLQQRWPASSRWHNFGASHSTVLLLPAASAALLVHCGSGHSPRRGTTAPSIDGSRPQSRRLQSPRRRRRWLARSGADRSLALRKVAASTSAESVRRDGHRRRPVETRYPRKAGRSVHRGEIASWRESRSTSRRGSSPALGRRCRSGRPRASWYGPWVDVWCWSAAATALGGARVRA
jgi:hypothetical protein